MALWKCARVFPILPPRAHATKRIPLEAIRALPAEAPEGDRIERHPGSQLSRRR